jgi:hypothetical protein
MFLRCVSLPAVATLGESILRPGLLAGAATRVIRLGVWRRVEGLLDIFA